MRSKVIQKNNTNQTSGDIPYREIRDLFEQSRRILIASHIDPDGDSIGAQLAFAAYLRSLGKEVFLISDNGIPEKYAFLPDVDSITHADEYDDSFAVDTALILECPNLKRIGKTQRFITPEVKIVNIDHHQDNEQFGEINWLNVGASSVGEMAFEYFRQVGFPISREVAEQLYTAILTDTGRFRYSSTSPRTMEIAGMLIAAGADPQKICDQVYYNLRPSSMKLIGKVLNSIEFIDDGTICLLTLTQSMFDESGAKPSETEGLVDFTLFARGVLVGALFKESAPRQTKVSFRSRDEINVAEVAARFNGGGHLNASGCTIPLPLEEARQEVIPLLRKARDGKSF